jgi:hypothetical protein
MDEYGGSRFADSPYETQAMRVLRARFTVRWMMIATAVLGITLAIVIPVIRKAELERLRTDYRKLQILHVDACNESARGELEARISLDSWVVHHQGHVDPLQAGELKLHASRMALKRDYHQQLADKYGGAVRRPWLPVKPDPPVPK